MPGSRSTVRGRGREPSSSGEFRLNRSKATLAVSAICFVISVPIAWSTGGAFEGAIHVFGFNLLTFLDEMTNTVLMPLGAAGSCIATGWLMDEKLTLNPMKTLHTLKKEGLSLGWIERVYIVMLKYVTPLLILFMDVMGIITHVSATPSYWWIVGSALLLIALSALVYLLFLKNSNTGDNTDEIIKQS